MNFFKNIISKRPSAIMIASGVLGVLAIYACVLAFGESEVDFNAEVRPIINTKCISCHGGVKKAGGFSLLFREEALEKTKSGKRAIIPGNPDKSEFIKRIITHDKELRMPLEKEPLSQGEIAIFKKWIKQGAKWKDHWAFLPVKNVSVPDIDDEFIKNDIDNFILEKLKEEKLKHAGEADKATLIRRVSLDLIGLPPTTKEVQDFVSDKSANAYEKVIDRLLQSPAYGERWAAMWLDLARFSDTKGYEKDQHRSIWRYRDYVINAFNEDKPYDKFTIEQIAGDLLPNPTEDQIIATAFHRNTMNNDEGGTNDEEFRTAAVVDRVNTTFDVLQGITIGCVQCHSHPYDPIRHKEYFSFMAFLNNTKDNDWEEESPTYITKKDYDMPKAKELIELINRLNGDKSGIPATLKEMRKKHLLPTLHAKDFDDSSKIFFSHPSITFKGINSYVGYKNINMTGAYNIGCSYVSDKGGKIEVRLDKPNGAVIGTMNMASSFFEVHETAVTINRPVSGAHNLYFVLKPNDAGFGDSRILEFKVMPAKNKNFKSRKQNILDSLRNELRLRINPQGTPVLEELKGPDRRNTFVFERGNWTTPGEQVEPDVPKAFNPLPKGAPKNRLGMAMWLTAKDNPLTARVQVNRVWEQLFGYGIVETVEDFGSQGNKPTHPELLDWMSGKFMNEFNWSNKKILKLIVMSNTYRQSSAVTPELLEKDPRNRFLARGPRVRLTAEQIRDQSLAVSGLLSKKMFGPSVMPHQPEGVWQTVYSGMEWKLSGGEDRYRRGVYTYMRRTSPYPNMLTFDAPSREFCVTRRIRTNTPLQALAVLNDTVTTQVSVALAKRMISEGGTNLHSQITKGYELALLRSPKPETINKLVDFYNKASGYYAKNDKKAVDLVGTKDKAAQLAPLSLVASVIINQDEFLTKE
jgi:hypothetical protein